LTSNTRRSRTHGKRGCGDARTRPQGHQHARRGLLTARACRVPSALSGSPATPIRSRVGRDPDHCSGEPDRCSSLADAVRPPPPLSAPPTRGPSWRCTWSARRRGAAQPPGSVEHTETVSPAPIRPVPAGDGDPAPAPDVASPPFPVTVPGLSVSSTAHRQRRNAHAGGSGAND
jgi:hypothetical protein